MEEQDDEISGSSIGPQNESLLAILFPKLRQGSSDGATAMSGAKSGPSIDIDPAEEYEFEGYLATLASYDLDKLRREPDMLVEEAKRLKLEMEDLAFRNYRTVIQSAQCVTEMQQEVLQMNSALDGLLGHLAPLSGACDHFSETAKKINDERRLNRITLQYHPQLLDLLELPQLMDTCVRNEHYEEALELQAFALKLKAMHSEIPLIEELVSEVKTYADEMLDQLLQLLRTNIQLPLCLRIIGYIRRLGVLKEQELRLHFLRCRDTWFQSTMQDLPTGNAYAYVIKLTDSNRVHLYDIITQYRAIFFDDTSAQEEPTTRDGGLLYGWVMQKVIEFLHELELYLPQISDGASLANVLEQCMYCGMSLGRVGVDFRGLLPALFEKCIYHMFSTNLNLATQRFSEALTAHKWLAPPPSLTSHAIHPTDPFSPPPSLLDHPPIAVLTNSFLSTFNELRLCAPVSMCGAAAACMTSALGSVTNILMNFKSERVLNEREDALFAGLCKACADTFLPYVSRCFDAVFHAESPLINLTPLFRNLGSLYAHREATSDGVSLLKARLQLSRGSGVGVNPKPVAAATNPPHPKEEHPPLTLSAAPLANGVQDAPKSPPSKDTTTQEHSDSTPINPMSASPPPAIPSSALPPSDSPPSDNSQSVNIFPPSAVEEPQSSPPNALVEVQGS